MPRHFLSSLFAPTAIAVVGASEDPGCRGGRVWRNLVEGGFQGALHPVHSVLPVLDGRPCIAALESLPAEPDLVVIAAPPDAAQAALDDAARAGARAAVLMGDDERPAKLAIPPGLRVLGPGSLGLIRPSLGLHAADLGQSASPGALALVSQSGAICAAVLDWAASRHIGFSTVVALGRGEGLDLGELLDFLALDPETRGILLYLEGLTNARGFMSGLRAAARLKLVVAIKAGRRRVAPPAVASPIGALVGEDDVFDAALRRAGAVRAWNVEQLFAAAELLAGRPRARGERLAVVTNAGGPGIMTADRAADLHLKPALPAAAAVRVPVDLQPGARLAAQPLDLGGQAGPADYEAAVRACLADPGVDGVIALLAPQAESQPTESAEAVARAAAGSVKPVLACWLGETRVRDARQCFARHRIPSFPSPESAVEAFAVLADFQRAQQSLLQVPPPSARGGASGLAAARAIVEGALAKGRHRLDPLESRALLRAFRIPVTDSQAVGSPEEAVAAAATLGYPVALKILSPDLAHRPDADGVRLDLRTPGDVAAAYAAMMTSVRTQRPEARIVGATVEPMPRPGHGRELLLGVIDDPVFGPAIGFGTGGTAAAVLRDRAVALPPLNALLAEELIARTRAARLLDSDRDLSPVQRAALVRVLLRVSELVCELPAVRELDINPLVADDAGVLALDACVVLRRPAPGLSRYGHMAIHPYPADLAGALPLRDGRTVRVRPIRPEDAAMEQAFVRGLSAQSRFLRFMNVTQELSPDLLARLTQLDYHRELALVATTGPEDSETQLAVARYAANPDGDSAEFALTVADAWQGLGLGRALLEKLIDAARERGFRRLTGGVLADNVPMLSLMRKLDFAVRQDPDDPALRQVEKRLS